MSDNVNNNLEIPDIVVERELELAKIRKEVAEQYKSYQSTLKYLACDAPIEVLCLNEALNNILLANGFLRVYDLFDMDFTKIKGIGVRRSRDLTASLDQFFSML